MKKLLCLVLGCALLCASFGALGEVAPTEAPTVVRGVKWGMTAEEIVALEGREPDFRETNSDGSIWLVFENVTAGGLPASVGYELNEAGTCCFISYTFDDVDTEDYNVYIEDYKNLENALVIKYGQPVLDAEGWYDSAYRENPVLQGLAVAKGDLVYQTNFKTENTRIALVLWGYALGEDSYYMDMSLAYVETTIPPRTIVLDDTL
ncbi:MAG: hypothetical protein LBN04_05550 [Oscillospiraceae bacterium]|jgi:hypothetical protein|nr:hypothetical protein [Oscillospiraceae bacterium]